MAITGDAVPGPAAARLAAVVAWVNVCERPVLQRGEEYKQASGLTQVCGDDPGIDGVKHPLMRQSCFYRGTAAARRPIVRVMQRSQRHRDRAALILPRSTKPFSAQCL